MILNITSTFFIEYFIMNYFLYILSIAAGKYSQGIFLSINSRIKFIPGVICSNIDLYAGQKYDLYSFSLRSDFTKRCLGHPPLHSGSHEHCLHSKDKFCLFLDQLLLAP